MEERNLFTTKLYVRRMKLLKTFSDTELVERFRQGDEKAFDVLYQRHQQKIFHTIVYYVKDREIAEDLSQEAYIKIITSIQANRYSEAGKFLPWALRIAHNHCMDHLRKSTRTACVHDTGLMNVAASSPETEMMKKQTAAHVQQLVDTLSAEQKEVVRYRHFEELSFKEIAKLTNSSVNTSLGRMRYALMHLRAKAQNHPAFR